MTTLNIALPDSLASFVSEQALRSGHQDPASYLKSLIRTAQRQAVREKLGRKLIEGLEPGPSVEATQESRARKKAMLVSRHRRARRS